MFWSLTSQPWVLVGAGNLALLTRGGRLFKMCYVTSVTVMTRFSRQVHTQGLDMTLRGLWKYAQIWTLMEEGTITGFGDDRTLQGEAKDTEVIKAYGSPM